MTKRAVRRSDLDMTQGSIIRNLLLFAGPLLVGNVFQQLYNTVDSIVVGNFVSKAALASVGAATPIINSLIGLFVGIGTGASVVIAQFYGAKEKEKLQKTVQTIILVTIVLSVLLTLVGVLFTPWLLRIMKTPDDMMESSSAYLLIYFGGLTGLLFYNMGSGILRAVGDSRHPLYFLIFSTCFNTVLDLVFVLVLKMGVEGVAYATIIAQFVSAVLVMRLLTITDGDYKITWKGMRIDWKILGKVLSIGIPAGVQQSLIAFSNIFVLSYINDFSSSCMAGYSAYIKIDNLLMLPMQTICLAVTTFVGQNLGAHEIQRTKQCIRKAALLICGITVLLIIPVVAFAPFFISLFNRETEVLEYGALFLRVLSPFYVFVGGAQLMAAALRGAGDANGPMIIMMSCYIGFRQLYLYVISRVMRTAIAVAFGFPLAWMVCLSLMVLYYRHSNWERKWSRPEPAEQESEVPQIPDLPAADPSQAAEPEEALTSQ